MIVVLFVLIVAAAVAQLVIASGDADRPLARAGEPRGSCRASRHRPRPEVTSLQDHGAARVGGSASAAALPRFTTRATEPCESMIAASTPSGTSAKIATSGTASPRHRRGDRRGPPRRDRPGARSAARCRTRRRRSPGSPTAPGVTIGAGMLHDRSSSTLDRRPDVLEREAGGEMRGGRGEHVASVERRRHGMQHHPIVLDRDRRIDAAERSPTRGRARRCRAPPGGRPSPRGRRSGGAPSRRPGRRPPRRRRRRACMGWRVRSRARRAPRPAAARRG